MRFLLVLFNSHLICKDDKYSFIPQEKVWGDKKYKWGGWYCLALLQNKWVQQGPASVRSLPAVDLARSPWKTKSLTIITTFKLKFRSLGQIRPKASHLWRSARLLLRYMGSQLTFRAQLEKVLDGIEATRGNSVCTSFMPFPNMTIIWLCRSCKPYIFWKYIICAHQLDIILWSSHWANLPFMTFYTMTSVYLMNLIIHSPRWSLDLRRMIKHQRYLHLRLCYFL